MTQPTYLYYPKGIGAMLRGWHNGPASVLDFRAMTGACPHDCPDCFTDKRKKTITLDQIKNVIDQAADLGYTGMDYLGEGETSWDKDCKKILEYTSKKGIIPILFTDAATRLRDREFVRILYDLGVTVSPKCGSLFNREYQNRAVRDKKGKYFDQRNEAIELLVEQGFNRDIEGMTRMGFDMVLSKENIEEVEKTLRLCRENNYWVVFTYRLPAGRSGSQDFDKSSNPSQEDLRKMRETIKRVDLEYGFDHPVHNNFGTMPCVEFIQIYGDGRVSPCPGNETIIGNIKTDSLKTLQERARKQFPCHKLENYTGNCPYRPQI